MSRLIGVRAVKKEKNQDSLAGPGERGRYERARSGREYKRHPGDEGGSRVRASSFSREAASKTQGVDKPTIRGATLYLDAHTSRSSASLSVKSRAIPLVTTTHRVPLEH